MVKVGSVLDPVKENAECVKDSDIYFIWKVKDTFPFKLVVLDKYNQYLVIGSFPNKIEALYWFDYYIHSGEHLEWEFDFLKGRYVNKQTGKIVRCYQEVITTRLNNKDSRISFRVSKEFYNWITDRAALSGMSVSDYVRYVLEDFRRSVQIAEKLSEVLDYGDESTSVNHQLEHS